MSDAAPDSPASPPPAEKKPKRKVGHGVKMALLEIIERRKYTDRPDYKAISARTGKSVDALKQLWKSWIRGEIDLGEPQTPEEVQIDARMQHENTLMLLKRYHSLLLSDFEAGLLTAEDMKTNGKKLAWKEVGLPQIAGELKRIMDIRSLTERGYNAVLEEQASARQPKNANTPPPAIETRTISASDEMRAIEALQNVTTETLLEPPPGGVPE